MIEEGHRTKRSLGFNPSYEAIVPSVRATKTPTHPEIKNQPLSPANLIAIIVSDLSTTLALTQLQRSESKKRKDQGDDPEAGNDLGF